jgi:hypothetical protein
MVAFEPLLEISGLSSEPTIIFSVDCGTVEQGKRGVIYMYIHTDPRNSDANYVLTPWLELPPDPLLVSTHDSIETERIILAPFGARCDIPRLFKLNRLSPCLGAPRIEYMCAASAAWCLPCLLSSCHRP